MNKKALLALIAALLVSPVLGAGEWKDVRVDDFHLKWMVDGPNLNIEVSAPTNGWVAVGFNPTRRMKDADIFIGYVSGADVVVQDHYGTGQFSHRPDTDIGGVNNLSNISGEEADGRTTLSFTVPLNSGDSADRPLVEGQTYKVIFASHTRDGITRKHNRRTSTEIVL